MFSRRTREGQSCPGEQHGLVFAASGFRKDTLDAIALGQRGDLTGGEHVAWTRKRGTPYVPSPLLHGEWVYYLSHYQGVLSRVHVQTGSEPAGPFRLEGMYNIYSSPVAAADFPETRLRFANRRWAASSTTGYNSFSSVWAREN